MKSLDRLFHVLCVSAGLVVTVCMFSISSQAYPRTDNDSIEKSCRPENDIARKILIAYDTIHGSTAEVAATIGEDLCAMGFRVDVKLAVNVSNVDDYDGFIVASGIYKFTWLPDALAFLDKFKEQIETKPTAIFIVCSGMAEDTLDNRVSIQKAFIDPVLRKHPGIGPVSVGLFGGAVDFTNEQYTVFEKIVLRMLGLIMHFKDKADWRNWDAIDAWAAEVGDKMK